MSEAQTAARVIGRYALFAQIAAGGMAAVHFGRLLGQAGFSRTVAIKRLHPHLAQDPEFVSMLLDEARLAARIRHPNVVSTLDVVALEGELLVVMEYVHGDSLARLLGTLRKEGARVPPAIASAIVSSVLYGLHAAHEATSESGEPLGIIHRDVSPQNVMVGTDGIARVVDFGVAKAAGRIQETREGQLKGKIRYMAPEQLKRGELDRAADIYAASVVLWECLVGRRLFDDDNEWKIADAILAGVTTAPSKLVPGVPAELDAIVLRGLSTDRTLRFRTAFDMAAALEEAVAPSTPRQVAAWLEKVADESLRVRAAKLAAIEGQSRALPHGEDSQPSGSDASQTGASSPRAAEPPPAERPLAEGLEPSHTSVGTAQSFAPSRARRSSAWAAGLGAVAGIFVLGLFAWGFGFVRTAPQRSSEPAASLGPRPEESAPKPPALATASAAPSAPEVSPVVEAEPEKDAQKSHTEKIGGGSASGSGKVTPGPRAKPPVADRTKPPVAACEPPYFFDANGVKHFKPECL